MITAAQNFVQLLFFVLIAGSSFWSAYLIALRFFPDGSRSHRWAAIVILQCWILIAVFHILALFSLFRLTAAIPVLFVLAFALTLRSRSGLALLAEDGGRAKELFLTLVRHSYRWIFAATALLVGFRVLRGLLAPPLGWDAITYHLPKVSLWIQHGGYALLPGPSANSYYRYYQTGGDVLWAWSMLPGPSDVLLAIAGLLVWLALVLVFFVVSRSFQTDPTKRALIAMTLAATPVILHYLTAAYIDTLLLLFLVVAIYFLVQWLQTGTPSFVIVSAAAFGLAAATKFTGILFATVGILIILVGLFRQKSGTRPIATLAACLIAIAIGSPDYVKAWIETGSPAYPFSIKVAGFTLFEGNPHLAEVLSGTFHPQEALLGAWEYFQYLFFTSISPWGHLNFGGGGLILLGFAVWGILEGYRQPERRQLLFVLIGFALLGILPFLPGSSAIYHTKLWAPIVGRLFLPSFGLLVLLSGIPDGKWFFPVWAGIAVVNLYLSIPNGLGTVDLLAIADLLPWLLAGAVVGTAAWLSHKKLKRRAVTISLAFFALLLLWLNVVRVRSDFRYRYYEAAADHREAIFDVHHLNPFFAAAWPVWQYFDQTEPRRLAVSAGWDGMGHNWYWQPLFGTRLQNILDYVPITRDGSMMEIHDRSVVDKKADFPSWLDRLLRSETDAVVLLAPRPPEGDWVEEHFFLFKPMIASRDQNHAAFSIDSTAAAAFLAADTCIHRSR